MAELEQPQTEITTDDVQKILSTLKSVMEVLNKSTQKVGETNESGHEVDVRTVGEFGQSVYVGVANESNNAVLDAISSKTVGIVHEKEQSTASTRKVSIPYRVRDWVAYHVLVRVPNNYGAPQSYEDFWKIVDKENIQTACIVRVRDRLNKAKLLTTLAGLPNGRLPSNEVMTELGFTYDDVRTPGCGSIFYAVALFDNIRMCADLLRWGLAADDIRFYKNEALLEAINKNNIDMVKLFLHFGLKVHDVRSANSDGITELLKTVVRNGNVDMLTLLFSAGLTVHDIRGYSNCVLKECCTYGNLPMLDALLTLGQLRPEDIRESGALLSAATNGHLRVCEILFERGLTFRDVRDDKNLALRRALGNNKLDVATWLIKVARLF